MYNDFLTERLHEKGATLVGFADLTILPTDIRKGYNYGVIIAKALNPHIISRIPTGVHLEYYEEYSNVSSQLHDLCEYTATLITDKGFNAFPQSKRYIKQDKYWRTPLPHKTIATLAGVGWIGKSALLVTEKYGSAIRITSVLTDMPFHTKEPITASRCGDCMVCTSLCPGKAVNGCNWYVGIDRDELLDPNVCKSTVIKRGEPFSLTEGTCGVCIAVCPYTQKYMLNFN